MTRNTFTRLLLMLTCSISIASMQAQPSPFYLETFPSENSFTDNWTQGGTNAGPESWVWSNNPTAIFNGQEDFASTTADNGFIQFNSDSNGDNSHDVFVTSPAIDCSGKDEVFIRFESQFGYFTTLSTAEVGVSTDGVNFTYREVLTDVPINDPTEALWVEILELPEAANQPNVFIRFRWQGRFEYVWRIDDIGLFDENPLPENDLSLELPRVPFNFGTPISQVAADTFGLFIENAGQNAQNNVLARLEITSNNGDSFSTTENIGTIAPGEELGVVFSETFTPSDTGRYSYTYTIEQNEPDELLQNNTFSGNFIVTQHTFLKDDNIRATATAPDMIAGEFWEIGNYFIINNAGFEASEISFAVASNNDIHQGQTVTVFLYRVEDDGDINFDNDDLRVVGFNTFTFTDEESGELVSVELIDLLTQENGVALTPGEYIASVQLTPDMFIVYSMIPYYYDFSTMVNNGQWFTGGFGAEQTAFIRLRIREMMVNTQAPQLADAQVQLYPNPVNRNLQLQLDLQNSTGKAQVQIVNAAGKTLLLRDYDHAPSQTLAFDASQWPPGAYFLHVRTAEGVKTKRFVVQR